MYKNFRTLYTLARLNFEEYAQGYKDYKFSDLNIYEQSKYVNENERNNFIDLYNWACMYNNINAYDDIKKKENDNSDMKKLKFKRHHILPRNQINAFWKKLTSVEQEQFVRNFKHNEDDTNSGLKIMESLRSNLFIGPADRCDDPKDGLDLLYEQNGDLEKVSKIYKSVSDLMTNYESESNLLKDIINLLQEAEKLRPHVRINYSDWIYDGEVKKWKKVNKPDS